MARRSPACCRRNEGEIIIQVASVAGNRQVSTGKRESRRAVIKRRREEARRIVALCAIARIGRVTRDIGIRCCQICLMAPGTYHLSTGIQTIQMAAIAGDSHVRTRQLERSRRMVEG